MLNLLALSLPKIFGDDSILGSDFFEIIGRILIYSIVTLIILGIIAITIGYYTFRTGKTIFPKSMLFIVELLYSPTKKVLKFFKHDPFMVDKIAIELRNHITKDIFAAVPTNERVIIVPQCLRSLKCPGRMSSEDGVHCIMCMKCVIGKFAKVGEKISTPLYIAPGGTFAKRILRQTFPKGVLGVACAKDLYEGTLMAKLAGIPSQGILLATIGCVETTVDAEKVIDTMLLNIEPDKAKKIKEEVL